MSTVALPRWVLGLLVGACAVCVVAVAFLLGRVTAPAPAAAPAEVEAAPTTAATVSGASSASTGLPPDPPRPIEYPVGHPAERVTEPPAGGAPDTAAVAAYFAQMDALSAEAKTSQDPQALARSVLEQAMSGNTSAIEGLIATQRSAGFRSGSCARAPRPRAPPLRSPARDRGHRPWRG